MNLLSNDTAVLISLAAAVLSLVASTLPFFKKPEKLRKLNIIFLKKSKNITLGNNLKKLEVGNILLILKKAEKKTKCLFKKIIGEHNFAKVVL